MQDQVAKHGFENSWWNELDQLSRRLNGLAAMCPKVLSQGGTGLDAWMGRQDARLSRPEAIRRLLEQALAAAQPAKSRTQKARSKALGLASTQLDRHLDQSAPDEERQRRKRRL